MNSLVKSNSFFRYLAIGDAQVSLSYAYRIGRATVSVIIRETVSAIIEVLKNDALAMPKNEEDWRKIAAG